MMKTSGFLLLLLLISSCGEKRTNISPRKEVKKLTVTISDEEISYIIKNQQFDCDSVNSIRCPEGIARLLIINKQDFDKSSVCTGFLIGEDVLVTNNHCINNQTTCDNTYVAIYSKYGYEENKCHKVLKSLLDYSDPEDPRKKLDVTVIKLKKPFFGKTFKLAEAKPKAQDGLTVWVIDHTGLQRTYPNPYESRVTELNCTLVTSQREQSLVLNNCPVISGNSGSPALNSNGEVVGIVWGGNLTKFSSNENLETRRSIPASAFATEAMYFKNYL